jgi:hypothetical protein
LAFALVIVLPGMAPASMAFFDDLMYTSTVPEPAVLGLLGIAAGLLVRRTSSL